MPRPPFKIIFLSLLCFFFILYYSLLFFLAKPQAIQNDIIRSTESASSGQLQFQRFKLSYFPVLKTEFREVQLQARKPQVLTFKAKRVKFYFSFWSFLFGKAEISKVVVDGGEIHVPTPPESMIDNLDIQDIRLRAKRIRGGRQVQVQWGGDLEGVDHSLAGKAIVGMQDLEKWDWKSSSATGDLFLKKFPLAPFPHEFFKKRDIQFNEGEIAARVHFQKSPQELWAHVDGAADFLGVVYEVKNETNHLVSPKMNLKLETEADWNPDEKQILLKRGMLASPLGKLLAGGKIFLAARALKDMHLTLSGIVLESLPQYYLPFKETVPFNFGFSGASDLEMSLEGTLDRLVLHANWDLTSAFLTYAGAFSKPKDMPVNFIFDWLLEKGSVLSGDFSLKIQDAVVKGSLTHLNFQTGEGQLNILTNKFKLQNWAVLMPPFQGYQLEGDIKIMANVMGNLLQRPREVKNMVNVILENGRITRNGDSLENISLGLDYSPLSLEIKNGQLQTPGAAPLVFNLTIYDPLTHPKTKARFTSEKWEASKMLVTLQAMSKDWIPKEWGQFLQKLHNLVKASVAEEPLDQFTADFETKEKQATFHPLQFKVYDGSVDLKGQVDLDAQPPVYSFTAEMDRLNLARYFARHYKGKKIMGGNFFLKGEFEGKSFDPRTWKDELKGKGVVSVTNGEFDTFSVLKAVGDIQSFPLILKQIPATTLFDDLQAEFQLAEGKAVTEKVTLLAPDFKALADGEITLGGLLNYRLNVFLSWALAKDILQPVLENPSEERKDSFGPILLLLSGTLEQPELKTDPSKLAELKENLAKKKVQKVLRTFLPEEALFKRLKSS